MTYLCFDVPFFQQESNFADIYTETLEAARRDVFEAKQHHCFEDEVEQAILFVLWDRIDTASLTLGIRTVLRQ